MSGTAARIEGKGSRRFVRRIARVIGWLLLLLVIALFGAAGWLAWSADKLLEPTQTRPGITLKDVWGEAAPAHIPAATKLPAIDWSNLASPPVDARPWVRWWWPGADVDPEELRRELGVMRDGGFGGVEIQPFTMGTFAIAKADPTAKRRIFDVDSERYFRTVRGVLAEAATLGMQVDLTHYTGWPGGSPAVTAEQNTQSLAWSETSFTGGKRVSIDIPPPSAGLNAWGLAIASLYSGLGDFGDFDPHAAKFVSAVVARPAGGSHSLFSMKDTQKLEAGSVRVVDGFIRDGKLVWDAPPGQWLLISSWILPTGEQASLAATRAPSLVVDILNRGAVNAEYNYVFGKRSGLEPFYGKPLRAIFNDSLEFKADRLGSADILTEFQRRRGYDLRPWLPVVYRSFADNFTLSHVFPKPAQDFAISKDDARIRYDYQLTLSELTVERFVEASRSWAGTRGLLSRGQSYGMDLDIIRAQGANDIPETEQLYGGGSDAFLRFASSGAMLYGRSLVSAEGFVWRDQDYAGNGAKLKLAADRMFLAGVNQIIAHGYPYDWRRGNRDRIFGPAGWDPWSSPERKDYMFSGNYSERTPLWADISQLNTYIARTQYLLRQGTQHADLLIYYPFLGYETSGYGPADTHEPLMFGEFPLSDPAGGKGERKSAADASNDERIAWMRKVQPLLDTLSARGVTWSWVNGDALRNQLMAGGRTRSGARFGGLLFADALSVPPEDMEAAKSLAASGTPIFLHGEAPKGQPGFRDAATGDRLVRELAAFLEAKGRLPAPPEAAAKTIASRISPSLSFAPSPAIRRYARDITPSIQLDLLVNQSDKMVTITLEGALSRGWWFDAITGSTASVIAEKTGSVQLTLAPFESRILVRGVAMPNRSPVPALFSMNAARTWNLSDWKMVAGKVRRSGLIDWRADADLRYANTTGIYRTRFSLPADAGGNILLTMPPQPGSVLVRINGVFAGNVSVPPGRLDIGRLLRPGDNAIEILYRQPLRNSMIGAMVDGDARYAQFKSRPDALVPAGLRGPVIISELRP
jgi:alpha-L-rhamnosidase